MGKRCPFRAKSCVSSTNWFILAVNGRSIAGNCIPTLLSFCRIPHAIGSACKMYKSGATVHPCLMDRDIGKYKAICWYRSFSITLTLVILFQRCVTQGNTPEWKKALSSLERINIYSKNCSINCIQNAIHSYNRLSLFVFSLIKK